MISRHRERNIRTALDATELIEQVPNPHGPARLDTFVQRRVLEHKLKEQRALDGARWKRRWRAAGLARGRRRGVRVGPKRRAIEARPGWSKEEPFDWLLRLPLSVRAKDVLRRSGCLSERDALTVPRERLMATRGCGRITATEIRQWQRDLAPLDYGGS